MIVYEQMVFLTKFEGKKCTELTDFKCFEFDKNLKVKGLRYLVVVIPTMTINIDDISQAGSLRSPSCTRKLNTKKISKSGFNIL